MLNFLNYSPSSTNHELIMERIAAIFVFTLIVSDNFIEDLLPCAVQYHLTNSMILKHIIGFLTLFFFGILALPQLANIEGMGKAFILYIIFVINTRTYHKVWLILFLLYAVVYLIHIARLQADNYLNNQIKTMNKDKKTNKKISLKEEGLLKRYMFIANYGYILEKICLYTIITLTVLGLIMFVGEKKLEFGKKFKWKDFLLLKPQCKRYPINHSSIELFTAAFKKV